MKRKMITFALVAMLGVSATSCYGPFKLTQNIHDWNGSVTGDKFVNELIFLGLCIIPVYEFCLFADAIVFNSVEFWTGSNPLAMSEGQVEKQIVKGTDGTYAITASHNQFRAEALTGNKKGEVSILKFNDTEQAWYLIEEGKSTKLIASEGSSAIGFLPSGQQLLFSGNTTKEEAQNLVKLSTEYAN